MENVISFLLNCAIIGALIFLFLGTLHDILVRPYVDYLKSRNDDQDWEIADLKSEMAYLRTRLEIYEGFDYGPPRRRGGNDNGSPMQARA